LKFFSVFINFKTIYTFLELRFDEEENFALLEHLPGEKNIETTIPDKQFASMSGIRLF
jgi:hypothetical protein